MISLEPHDSMLKITPQEIAQLEQWHQQYHARHADQFGPMESCTQVKCVELKLGIAWLKRRLASNNPVAA
jgi:hypothetical protein